MKFGLVGNTTKPIIKKVIPDLFNWLNKKQIDFVVEEQLLKYLQLSSNTMPSSPIDNIGKLCEVVLAFGGDGTILSTARAVGQYGVPILGVNLGRLGFLAEVSIAQLYDSIQDILDSRYTVLERMVLKAQVINRANHLTFYSLNDIVIDKGSYSRLMQVKIYINEEFLTTYLCDGVIIATPTGSTAYSLSAQGPILSPNVNAIIINPICPHSLGARPMVISDNSEIKIIPSIGEKKALLSADGQVEDCIKSDELISVKQADYKVRWIQYKGNTFFHVLRTKLNWGVDTRMD